MPNWCMNDITIRHRDPEMVKRAADAMTRGEFLQEFLPCPQELREHQAPQTDPELAQQFVERFGHSDWYNWQVNTWGTKWDIGGEDSDVQCEGDTVTARFDSAWAPPISAYERLCEQGFEIDAFYWEPGMAFCGRFQGSSDGTDDDYREYSDETADTVREAIGEELDDHWNISENLAEWTSNDEEDQQ